MYVCMYVCMYVYMYVCMYVCIRIYEDMLEYFHLTNGIPCLLRYVHVYRLRHLGYFYTC
jgi:hypothetical protein